MRKGWAIVVLGSLIAGAIFFFFFLNRADPVLISDSAAIAICANAAEVTNAPKDTEAVLDQEPAERYGTRTTATWGIFYESRKVYLDCLIDAESGEILLMGVRGH